ncbi:MAG: FAD-binding oxidoreductase, partial [Betaproteobacteria bacterium]|nr:FAD-binding oxidoreductase [Betaproteobacteria bacterium]
MSPARRPELFLDALLALLGPGHVQVHESDMAAWTRDWRGRYQGRALALAEPADTAQVAELVQLCAAHRVALVPQGGNTGLAGGATPDGSGRQLLVSLRRLNRIRELSVADGVLV